MSRIPRVALGAVGPDVDSSPIVWALMDALDQSGFRLQYFSSRACFGGFDAATTITGHAPRHLDTWLMSPELCRDLFLKATKTTDIAIVEGQFSTGPRASAAQGGALDELCTWLDLPRIAVLDASQMLDCRLPQRPTNIQGILLDRVTDLQQAVRLQTVLEGLWTAPVLGWLPELPAVRRDLAMLKPGMRPSRELCSVLGNKLSEHLRLELLARIASHRDFPFRPSPSRISPTLEDVHVAVAYDEAFYCYFPDTLDMLESRGARVSDFSPLRDEQLPADTDIVYFGCGHPERYAELLVQNHCMLAALRDHHCNGRRTYAECGGLAYLCRYMELADGSRYSMLGALPAVAIQNPQPRPPLATEVRVATDTWLAKTGHRLRGYVNDTWNIDPLKPLHPLASDPEHAWDLVGRHQAIGSRLHLNFAAQPQVLESFFEPHAAALDLGYLPAIPQ